MLPYDGDPALLRPAQRHMRVLENYGIGRGKAAHPVPAAGFARPCEQREQFPQVLSRPSTAPQPDLLGDMLGLLEDVEAGGPLPIHGRRTQGGQGTAGRGARPDSTRPSTGATLHASRPATVGAPGPRDRQGFDHVRPATSGGLATASGRPPTAVRSATQHRARPGGEPPRLLRGRPQVAPYLGLHDRDVGAPRPPPEAPMPSLRPRAPTGLPSRPGLASSQGRPPFGRYGPSLLSLSAGTFATTPGGAAPATARTSSPVSRQLWPPFRPAGPLTARPSTPEAPSVSWSNASGRSPPRAPKAAAGAEPGRVSRVVHGAVCRAAVGDLLLVFNQCLKAARGAAAEGGDPAAAGFAVFRDYPTQMARPEWAATMAARAAAADPDSVSSDGAGHAAAASGPLGRPQLSEPTQRLLKAQLPAGAEGEPDGVDWGALLVGPTHGPGSSSSSDDSEATDRGQRSPGGDGGGSAHSNGNVPGAERSPEGLPPLGRAGGGSHPTSPPRSPTGAAALQPQAARGTALPGLPPVAPVRVRKKRWSLTTSPAPGPELTMPAGSAERAALEKESDRLVFATARLRTAVAQRRAEGRGDRPLSASPVEPPPLFASRPAAKGRDSLASLPGTPGAPRSPGSPGSPRRSVAFLERDTGTWEGEVPATLVGPLRDLLRTVAAAEERLAFNDAATTVLLAVRASSDEAAEKRQEERAAAGGLARGHHPDDPLQAPLAEILGAGGAALFPAAARVVLLRAKAAAFAQRAEALQGRIDAAAAEAKERLRAGGRTSPTKPKRPQALAAAARLLAARGGLGSRVPTAEAACQSDIEEQLQQYGRSRVRALQRKEAALGGAFRALMAAVAHVQVYADNLEVELSCQRCWGILGGPHIVASCGQTVCSRCLLATDHGALLPRGGRLDCGCAQHDGAAPNETVANTVRHWAALEVAAQELDRAFQSIAARLQPALADPVSPRRMTARPVS